MTNIEVYESKAPWQEKVAWAQALRDNSLAKVTPALENVPAELPPNSQKLPHELLTEREIELTQNYTAIELIAQLQSRKLTSEELTRAFLRRAAVAHIAVSFLLRWHLTTL